MSKKWRSQVLKRKNFIPTFIITIGFWVSLILLILGTDPNQFGILYLFFILFFFCVFLLSAILLVHTRRGLFVAVGTTLFVFFRYIGVGTFLNFFFITAFFTLIELYLSQIDKEKHRT